jgi:hypothetical protein
MHAPLPDAYKRPPYRRSWTEAGLRLAVTVMLLTIIGVPIYLVLVASDVVPNEDFDFWRLRILWWSFIALIIVGLRCLAWMFDALVPSRSIPNGPATGSEIRPVHHA